MPEPPRGRSEEIPKGESFVLKLEPLEEGMPDIPSCVLSLGNFATQRGKTSSARVAPVAIGHDPSPMQVPFCTSMLQMQLARNLRQPIFDEKETLWVDFVWDWEAFWEGISEKKPHSDAEKLQVFENCFSEDLRKEIQFMKRGGEKIGFTHVFALFASRFGQKKGAKAREAWYSVNLPNSGKIGTVQWRRFCLEFMAGQRNVPDVGEGEAKRLLMARIPHFMAAWVVKNKSPKTGKARW